MLGEMHCKGFKAILLAHCATRDGLVYLRLLAPPGADKAIWAALNTREARRGSVLSDITLAWGEERERRMQMQKYVRYLTPRAALPCGYTDLAFLHPDATTAAGDAFYLIDEAHSDGPPPAFFPMLNARRSRCACCASPRQRRRHTRRCAR